MKMDMTYEEYLNKWEKVLDHEDVAPIQDRQRRLTTAIVLENTLKDAVGAARAGGQMLFESPNATNVMGGSSSTHGTGNIDTFDPILISLVRRAVPNLIAYDVCGVQPMTGPTGLIFAMRSRYGAPGSGGANSTYAANEAFYNEANTAFSTVLGAAANTLGSQTVGANLASSNNAGSNTYNTAWAMNTAQLEALGTDSNTAFAKMSITVEKVQVTAGGRALMTEYTPELAQDLKAIHGLDADAELAAMLQTEALAEINREVLRSIYVTAYTGCQTLTTTPGVFDLDTDSNGRWLVEKFKGLMFRIELEANAIAKTTRRGKGNILICSSNVASALQMAGVLSNTPALNSNNLQVDDTGATFAGVLNGRIKVYIDPYAGNDFCVLGYKGQHTWDAGLFYTPYVPLSRYNAVDPNSFQPRMAFKTRYGLVSNPFCGGLNIALGQITQDSNYYYRRFLVNNLI